MFNTLLPVWTGMFCLLALCAANTQAATTILFDDTGAEAGITVPGTTDFSFEGSSWTGGEVATEMLPQLNASGEYSYEIGPSGGAVTFTEAVYSVDFFFVHAAAGFAPSPRGGAPAVWLTGQNKMALFGGMLPITGDTWEYDAGSNTWQELSPETQGPVPAARCHHTLVSDSANENITMFGGFSFLGRFNDLWRYDSSSESWEELLTFGTPPIARCLHTSAFMSSRGEMLVYGGVQRDGFVVKDMFEDTYTIDLASPLWRLVNTSGPGLLRGPISFYSTVEDAVYLWGGAHPDWYPTTLWRFDGEERMWEEVPTTGDVPVGREDTNFFWDDTRQVLHIFSGQNFTLRDFLLNDLYSLDLTTATWQAHSVDGAPSPRWRASTVFDPATSTGVLFGGWLDFGGGQSLSDTWTYDTINSVWTEKTTFQFPPGVATAFDASGMPISSVETNLATFFGDLGNFVTLNSQVRIARIEFASGVIDNFSYSDELSVPAVPTVSAWGMVAMAMSVLSVGTLVIRRSSVVAR